MATGKPPFSSNSLKDLIAQIIDATTPKIEFCSKEFNDLVFGLLEKDPARRSTWDNVRNHPFWEESFPEMQLPPQPQFDNYLAGRGIKPQDRLQLGKLREPEPKHFQSAAATPHSKISNESDKKSEETVATTGTKSEKRRDIDLLRLSQNVKKNILKDAHDYKGAEVEKGKYVYIICRPK